MKRALFLLVLALTIPTVAQSDAACEGRCQAAFNDWASQCYDPVCTQAATCQRDICVGGCNGGIREVPESCPQS